MRGTPHTLIWTHSTNLYMPSPSPWPVLCSVGLVSLLSGFVLHWRKFWSVSWMSGGVLISVLGVGWAWKLRGEGALGGEFLSEAYQSFRVGILFFIMSEALFFFSFFWSTYDESWLPMLLAMPMGSNEIPLVNTALLLGSGASLTYAHDHLLGGWLKIPAMYSTMLLGSLFFGAQCLEYAELPFGFGDGPCFSAFFLMTGFHGSHVVIGLTLLVLMTVHMGSSGLSSEYNTSFEGAAWYWHFVDVIWMVLVSSLYGPSVMNNSL